MLEQKKVFLREIDTNKYYKLSVWDIGQAEDSDINSAVCNYVIYISCNNTFSVKKRQPSS